MHNVSLYLVATLAAFLGQFAEESTNPLLLMGIALASATIPVLVSWFFTRKKMNKQNEQIQEVHLLVNARLSRAIDALSDALQRENILKQRLGVTIEENKDEAEPGFEATFNIPDPPD